MTSRPLSRHSLSSRRGGYSPSSNHNIFRILSIQISLLSCTCFVGLAFYLGAIFGAGLVGSDNPVSISTDLHRDACPKCDGLDQSKIDQVVEQRVTEKMASIPENNEKVAANAETDFNSVAFPRSMSRFVHGMASANTDEFIDLMDYGYPHDHHKGDGRDEVLVFYVNDVSFSGGETAVFQNYFSRSQESWFELIIFSQFFIAIFPPCSFQQSVQNRTVCQKRRRML